MAWSNRDFDPQVLSAALLSAAKKALANVTIPSSQDPEVKASEIVEYDGRMRISGVEKFNTPCYLSVINLYTSQGDADKRSNVKGAVILYIEAENAGKFFKTLEISFPDDEDDISMMAAAGQMANIIADNLKSELAGAGYATLFSAKPQNFKNSAVQGVEFHTSQKDKHEIGFFYFRHKVIAVEVTLAPLPKK